MSSGRAGAGLSCPVHDRYSIRLARPCDLAALPAIERAAAELFHDFAPEAIDSDVTSEQEFAHAQASSQLWVALCDDAAVGFALVDLMPSGLPHLEEIDVHPRHGRQGLGTALVRTVCRWVEESGHPSLTLTTFRGVRWNMPFYARMGFEAVPAEALSDEMIALVMDEATRGLAPEKRVVMRYFAKS
jgi:GNAT superfamily N-acetyltransferase